MYECMANYWPNQFSKENDPIVADKMNTVPKIVFSKTLEKAEWDNSRLVKEHVAEEVSKLKQQPGKDLAIFGSSDLALMVRSFSGRFRRFSPKSTIDDR